MQYGNPVLEWMQAAHWANYRFFDEFLDLPAERQNMIIAAYRTEKQIESVLAYRNTKK